MMINVRPTCGHYCGHPRGGAIRGSSMSAVRPGLPAQPVEPVAGQHAPETADDETAVTTVRLLASPGVLMVFGKRASYWYGGSAGTPVRTKPMTAAGKAGACSRPGRRLGRALSRADAAGRGGRRRAPSPLPPGRWWPAVTRHQHRAEHQQGAGITGAPQTHLNWECVTSGAYPLDPARDYPGGGRNLSSALLRRVPSGRPLTEPRPRVPRTLWRPSGWGRSGEASPSRRPLSVGGRNQPRHCQSRDLMASYGLC